MKRVRHKPAGTAYLYVMGLPDGPQKIGHTCGDPHRRLRLIVRSERRATIAVNGNRYANISVAKAIKINPRWALAAERYAHWLLRDRHYRNEWFNVSPDEAIAAIETASAAATAQNYAGLKLIPTIRCRAGVGYSVKICMFDL
jgi:T5orf172 domain